MKSAGPRQDPRLRYRRFGKTELSMPVLSCGGMRYQSSWKDDPADSIPAEGQRNLEATIERALELGIYHIETARGYGTSELQLGMLLPKLPRQSFLLQTKINPKPTRDAFLKEFDTSRARLGLDYVDLLSLHGINDPESFDNAFRRGGSLEAALELKERGLARQIGFSTHGPTRLILETLASGAFDYMNVHWYFVNDLNRPAVLEAARRDMGVFIISPNDKGGRLYAPPARFVELCRPLTPMQFNDLYCLSRPEVHTLSVGAARPTDFDEHVAALEHYERLADVMGPVAARLQAEMERMLGRDWCEGWKEGLPDYADMPGEVNALEILRVFAYAKCFDLVEWAKGRYNLLGQGGGWFPGKNAADLDEPALRRALHASPLPERVISSLREAHTLLADAPRPRQSQGG